MPSFFNQLQAGGTTRPRRSFFNELQAKPPVQPEAEPEFNWFDTAVGTGLRVGGAFAGAGLAGLLATPETLGLGTIPAAVAGGAAGGAGGEWLAEEYEKARGLRKEVSPTSIAVEGALGAVPIGKSATLLRAAAKGAGMGVAGTAAHSIAEEGELPDWKQAGLSALFGGAFGAGGEAIGRRFEKAAPEVAAAIPEDVVESGGETIRIPRPPVRAEAPDEWRVDPRSSEAFEPNPRFAEEDPHPGYWTSDVSDVDYYNRQKAFDRDLERQAWKNEPPTVRRPYDRDAAGAYDWDVSQPSPRPSGLFDFLRRQAEIEDGIAAERRAAEAFDAEATPQRAADAIIPERLKPPPPERAAWEEVPGRYATDSEAALQELVPKSVLHGPDDIRTLTEQATKRPSMLSRLFGAADEAPPVRADTPEPRAEVDPRLQGNDPRQAEIRAIDKRVADPAGLDDSTLLELGARRVELLNDLDANPPSRLSLLLGSTRGAAANEAATALAGAGVGGAAGATQGETPEEHVKYGLLGALLGAGGAHYGAKALARMGAQAPGAPGGAAEAILNTDEHVTTGARGMKDTAPGVDLEALKSPPPVKTPTGTYAEASGDHPIVSFERQHIPRAESMTEARRTNYGLESFPEEQRPFIKDLLDEHGGYEAQRRGVQTNARTEALASHIELSMKDPLSPGTNLPAAGQRAYANAVVSVTDKLREVSQRIKAGAGSDADLFEQARLKSGLDVLLQSFYGTRAEAGRALQAHSMLKRLMPSEVRLVREMLDRGRLRKDLYDLSDVMANLPSDPVAAFEVLRSKQVRTKMQVASDYYMSNILSGLKTQQRNILGNATKLVTRVLEKAGTGGLDALHAMMTGKGREVYSTEALHEMQGGIAGLSKAFEDATFTFGKGFSRESLIEGLEDVSSLYVPKAEFKGGLKNPLNLPGRALEAADRFFYQLNSSMELHALSYAKARQAAEQQGLTGAAYNQSVSSTMADLRANPTREMKKAIASTAERATFKERNAVGNQLIGLKKQLPALNFVIPFVNTVANIFKQGVEHTPAGFFMKRARGIDVSAREQMIARGEAALGSMALMPVAYMAATGQISGSGPTDPAKRAALYESGWRPNSIRIGDDWYSYSFAQPLSVPLSLVANGFDAWHEISQDANEQTKRETAEKMVAETVARVGKSALDQSFLSGLGDLFKAINDPEKAASGWAARILGGFVPLSSAQRDVAQLIDPTVRAPEGIGESIATGIPFASQAVQPRLDRWGENINRERAAAVNVLEGSDVVSDTVADELTRLGLDVGLPSDRISFDERISPKRPLTREEAFGLRQTRGRAARTILHSVMSQPGYANLPDVMKAQLLTKILRNRMGDVNDVARVAIQGGRPELLQQLSDPLEELAAATYAGRRP